jgi:hypothetical protein
MLTLPYFALASAMACRVFRIVLLGVPKDIEADTLDIVNFYHSPDSDPHRHDHHNNGNEKRGCSPEFKNFVAVEASMSGG